MSSATLTAPIPKVLIVEDDDAHADFFKRLFGGSHPDWPAAEVVPKFEIVLVHTGREAKQYLEKAYRSGEVIDLLLLDLRLPEEQPEEEPDEDVGFDILRKVTREWRNVCAGVAIASSHTDYPLLREALQIGADDYVDKGGKPEDIYRSCVAVYRKGVAKAWAALRQEREQTLVRDLSCARVADGMAGVVSDGVNAVLSRLDDLGRQLQERYQLSPQRDMDDPICRTLHGLRRSALGVARECARMRSDWVRGGDEEVREVRPSDRITSAADWLLPGLLHYGTRLEQQGGEGIQVRTFSQDLDLILREILFDALEATGETAPGGAAGKAIVARVMWDEKEKAVEVAIEDAAAPLPEDLDAALDSEEPIGPAAGREGPDPAARRRARLSLAQQVARGIGARLSATRSPSGQGNTITLRLPGLS